MIRRRFCAVVSAVSLLLCLAVVGLWVRSYGTRYRASIGWGDAKSSKLMIANIQSLSGDIVVSSHRIVITDSRQFPSVVHPMHPHFYFEALPVPSQVFWHGLGFGYNGIARGDEVVQAVAVPDWLLVLLLAICPAWWCISNWRKSRLRRPGQCNVCGYDLRASPICCPECGTPVEGKAALKT